MSKYEIPNRTVNLLRIAKWHLWPSTALMLHVNGICPLQDSSIEVVRESLEKYIGPFEKCWDWRYETTYKPNGILTEQINIRVFGRKTNPNLTFMMLTLMSKNLDLAIKM